MVWFGPGKVRLGLPISIVALVDTPLLLGWDVGLVGCWFVSDQG